MTFTTPARRADAVRFRVLVQNFDQLGRVLIVAIPLTRRSRRSARLVGIEVIVPLVVLGGLRRPPGGSSSATCGRSRTMAVTADASPPATSRGACSRPSRGRRSAGSASASTRCSSRIEAAFAERAATEEKLRRFLADASHELRTPLTSIRGYAEVFARAKDDPEDLGPAMRRIEEESKRMGVMVEELLVLARLGEGREPERAPVDLARVVDDAVNDARAAAPPRAIALERDGGPSCWATTTSSARSSPTSSATPCATRPPGTRSA